MHLGSGLSVGLAGVAAGYTIGIVGDAVSSLFSGDWVHKSPSG
jgi:F0F1-type ATP synthase membrane subunit c/vacuolar-type H+-ATPase subunit K